MVSYTKSSISTRSRSNTSTSFTTASTTSTARAAYHSSSVNRRKLTCDSSGPPASLFTPAAIKAKESTKTDEPGPVWAVTPFCHYYSSSRDMSVRLESSLNSKLRHQAQNSPSCQQQGQQI